MAVKNFDVVDFIIQWESGEISDSEFVYGFQYMINEGLVWQLQGMYGRTASELIKNGLCLPAGEWTPDEAVENFEMFYQ